MSKPVEVDFIEEEDRPQLTNLIVLSPNGRELTLSVTWGQAVRWASRPNFPRKGMFNIPTYNGYVPVVADNITCIFPRPLQHHTKQFYADVRAEIEGSKKGS